MSEPQRCDIALAGCTPEPLMAYLKALGILRLVSEQEDHEARGWWRNDVFWLRSALDTGGLIEFFLKEYVPTPLVAPWNAGSGFYLKWDERKKSFKQREASEAVSTIERSVTARLKPYRDQIAAVKNALKERAERSDPAKQIAELRERGKREGWSQRKSDAEVKKLLDGQMLLSAEGSTFAIRKVDKDELVRDTRSALLNEAGMRWIDAAFVIRTGQKKNRAEAPLLGSGGNIGNSDFSARFMEILALCLPLDDDNRPSHESVEFLQGALFGGPTAALTSLAVDQFDPGRAGGANMHQGMEAGSRLNPWDYILMLEGALVLQSASSKRLGAGAAGSAFPFTVQSTAGGFTSCGLDTTRGEQWLPLWRRPCTASEIEMLLAEGRADLGHRQARTGVDFVRAAVSLGVDRGIQQFVRVQYQARFGENYLANALGRVDTVPRAPINLLNEIDYWLEDFRRKCAVGHKNDEAPKRIISTLVRLDSAIFDFCKYGGPRAFQEILLALGRTERALALRQGKLRKGVVNPIPMLTANWLDCANDGSPEFTLAVGLASIYDSNVDQKIGPLRANLESVDWQKRCRAWAQKDRAVVWNGGDVLRNLTNVLERRMMDGERTGGERLPLASRFTVPLETVAAFIDGALDDGRVEDLIWGLMLADPRRRHGRERIELNRPVSPPLLPRDYALLKLLFLPRPLVPERAGDRVRWRFAREGEAGVTIRAEPRIPRLLRGGRIGDVCRIAAERLRASGLPSMPRPLPTGLTRDREWAQRTTDARRGQRLAAALLVPVSSSSVNRLVGLVCRDKAAAAETFAMSIEGEAIR